MKTALWVFCIVLPTQLFAQQNYGPRLTALGNSNAAVVDVWAIESNAAAITQLTEITASINYTKHYLSDDISTQGATVVIPIDNNFISLGLNRYGLSSYNENKISFAYAKKFGPKYAIAITVNYHQLTINNYGSTNGFSVNVGVYNKLNDKFSLGAYITNPSDQAFANKQVSIPIQTAINVGASYFLSDKVFIASNISKQLHNPIDISVGLEYKLIEILALRAGVAAKPFKQFAGFGVNLKKFFLDFATTFDTNLGYSPQIALGYGF